MKHHSSSFGVAPLRFQDDGLIDDSRGLADSSYASTAPAEASLVASRWLGPRALMTAKSRSSAATAQAADQGVVGGAFMHCSLCKTPAASSTGCMRARWQ